MPALSSVLAATIEKLRMDLGDPFARVAVVVPSPASAALAQRSLGAWGPFVQVRFVDPEDLLFELGAPGLIRAGFAPEPPGWLEAIVLALARGMARAPEHERYAESLSHPRWAPVLARAIAVLEGAGVEARHLRDLGGFEDERRTALLADLLEAVGRARVEAGLHGRAEVLRAALELELDRAPRAVARDRGHVVLGDRALAPLAEAALARWLATRPGYRIDLEPHARAPAAQSGLRRAASALPAAPARLEGPVPPPTLDALQRSLLGARAPGAVLLDDSVHLVQALDERREAREVARVVLDAVREGTPLDRIAVAVPNAAEVDLLWAELERARVPFVSLVGPSLATTPAAGLLLELLALGDARPGVGRIHRLLLHPELSREALPPAARRVRSRWRRLLRALGPLEGLEAIRAAARAALDGLGAPDRPAGLALVEALDRLVEASARFPLAAPWSRFLEAGRDLAKRWLRDGPVRERLLDVLGPGASSASAAGPLITRDDARSLLRARIEARSLLVGRINDPCVRLVPPLEALAVEADVVVACGLAEGVFPQRPRQDPVLVDPLVARLRERHGLHLEGSEVRDALEDRRFAAVVGAARRRLVLTFPRSELMSGRPVAPGRLLHDVAHALGHPLEALVTPAPTDAAGAALDPGRAVSAAEHRLALVHARPQDGLRAAAAHPFGRRLLALHRALDRARAAGARGALALGPFGGEVPAGLLTTPLLRDAEVRMGLVARALRQPDRHFFGDLLRAWRPWPFPEAGDPFDRGAAVARLARRARALAAGGVEDLEAALRAALDAEADSPAGALERRALDALGAALRETGLEGLRSMAPAPAALPRFPARLAAEEAALLVAPDAVVDVAERGSLNKGVFRVDQALRPGLRALSAAASAAAVERLGVVTAAGEHGCYRLSDVVAELDPMLDLTRRLAERGWWPFTDGSPFALARDVVVDVVADRDRLLAALAAAEPAARGAA